MLSTSNSPETWLVELMVQNIHELWKHGQIHFMFPDFKDTLYWSWRSEFFFFFFKYFITSWPSWNWTLSANIHLVFNMCQVCCWALDPFSPLTLCNTEFSHFSLVTARKQSWALPPSIYWKSIWGNFLAVSRLGIFTVGAWVWSLMSQAMRHGQRGKKI